MRAPEFADIVRAEFAPGERERIEKALSELRRSLETTDRKTIGERTHELNDATRHLAEIRMNRSVQAALSGKSIDTL
jgi:hypothetical protein